MVLTDIQEALRPQFPTATIAPVILSSDKTHLSRFSGDKKAWPVYLTIGNTHSRMRNSPSKMTIILVALLPVPLKFSSKTVKT